MSFSEDQIAKLSAPLLRTAVRQRAQAGRQLSYLEGWHCIAEANRIFGFDAWDRETVELRECGEPRQVGDKFRVAFMCRVRIRVATKGNERAIVRDGTGYGSGIDKDLGQAYESAIKEAETDAMKRALMTFGNPFGLALYDKDQANVADAPREVRPAPAPTANSMSVDQMMHEVGICMTNADLTSLKADPAFRAGYKGADEVSRKRIEGALAKAAEDCAA